MAQSVKDMIRAKTLGAKVTFRSTVFEYEGVEVEFRQPSLKGRKILLDRAKNASGEMDMTDFIVWAVICNTYVPGTNELVFEDSDYDMMVNTPAGSFVEQFGQEIANLMNVESDPKS